LYNEAMLVPKQLIVALQNSKSL